MRVGDLATREPVGEPLRGHDDAVWAVATGVVNGRTVAVTGSLDATVRANHGEATMTRCWRWRPRWWTAARPPSPAARGRPVAVIGGTDGIVRVWDLAHGRQVGDKLVFPMPVSAVAVAPDGRLVVGFCDDPGGPDASLIGDVMGPRGGQPRGGPLRRRESSVPRAHAEEIAVEGEAALVLVKLGVWVSNTKSRWDKLTEPQRAAFAELGVEWGVARGRA